MASYSVWFVYASVHDLASLFCCCHAFYCAACRALLHICIHITKKVIGSRSAVETKELFLYQLVNVRVLSQNIDCYRN